MSKRNKKSWHNIKPAQDRYTNSPLDTFDRTIATVNKDRSANYGHPAVNFDRIARMRSVIEDCADPRMRVGLGEIADRLARLVENPYHIDAYIDIAGYARANVMVIQCERMLPDEAPLIVKHITNTDNGD